MKNVDPPQTHWRKANKRHSSCTHAVAALMFCGVIAASVPCLANDLRGAPPPGWQTYRDEKLGYSISYPKDWHLETDWAHYGNPDDPTPRTIPGIALFPPASLNNGNYLDIKRTLVSVEHVDDNLYCGAEDFIPEEPFDTQPRTVVQTKLFAISAAAIADKSWQDIIYLAHDGNPCLAVTYRIEWWESNDPKARPYDSERLMQLFGRIRATFRYWGTGDGK